MINKKYLDELKKTSSVLEWTIKAASDNEKKYLDSTQVDIKKAVEFCKNVLVFVKKMTGEKTEDSSGLLKHIQEFHEKVSMILEQFNKIDKNELNALDSAFKSVQDAEQVTLSNELPIDTKYQRSLAEGKAIAEKYFDFIDELRKKMSEAQDILEKILEDRNAFSALDAEIRMQVEQALKLFLTLETSICNLYLQLSFMNIKKKTD